MNGDRPVAMVTGGVRRVGLATAQRLARAGLDLVLTYRSSEEEARAAARGLESIGARVRLERVDLGDLGAVEALGEKLTRELARLVVLVLNASVYGRTPLAGVSAVEEIQYTCVI